MTSRPRRCAELPAGRAPIQTNVVPLAEQPAWLDRACARVREEVGQGAPGLRRLPAHRRATRTTRTRAGDDDDGRPMAAVEEVAPMLAAGPLQGLRVEMLHGRMAPDGKDARDAPFAAGDIDVLVATTVIEVGVDVANATMMVVLDAERFGVSQLHQLRGRVGPGRAAGALPAGHRRRDGDPGARAARRGRGHHRRLRAVPRRPRAAPRGRRARRPPSPAGARACGCCPCCATRTSSSRPARWPPPSSPRTRT